MGRTSPWSNPARLLFRIPLVHTRDQPIERAAKELTAELGDATVAHVRRADPPISFATASGCGSSISTRRRNCRGGWAPSSASTHATISHPRTPPVSGPKWTAGSRRAPSGHRPDGGLECVIAEVHNTYGGRHAYLLRPDADGNAHADKECCVSSFQSTDGGYRMAVPRPGPLLSVRIALRQGGRSPLTASLLGVRRPATARWLARLLLTRPFMSHRVSALIRRHGARLWLKKAPLTPRTPQTTGGRHDG
ncbi:Protein of unknown function [Amycolatopsis regifaucium]|nr:Protein of unknown function [Amycolatopsis regifaucium]